MGAGSSAVAGLKGLKEDESKALLEKLSEEEALLEEATKLDASDTNRSNIAFSRLSMKVADALMKTEPKLEALEKVFEDLAAAFKSDSKPPFCAVEGVKYAIDALKFKSIEEEGHVMITVPFYCEFERGAPSSEENPNGEDSPIQKIEEALWLLKYGEKMSITVLFVNDSIAEKKDEKDGGSPALFKKSILAFCKEKEVKVEGAADENFESCTALDGRLSVSFTSVGTEAGKKTDFETVEEKTKRMENRGEDGKLRERKGGAVLAGMETPLPKAWAEKSTRVIRCLVDGDSAHPLGSFIGDAAYAVLQQGNMAYLGNMKHKSTCISIVGADAGGGDDATQARVANRKLYFSGFIVPFCFAELTDKYKYTGTTQLPVKSFRGDVDFAKAKLTTVQPNVDLGMLALLVSVLNEKGGTIASGPVTIRDNVASSTMTSSDLNAEWTKTYGPIFTQAVGLARTLKPEEFKTFPEWLVQFLEGMTLEHYSKMFGDEITEDVTALFKKMADYRAAEDRSKVLEELKGCFGKVFPDDKTFQA